MELQQDRRRVFVWFVVIAIHTAIAAFAVGASVLNAYMALPSRACTFTVLALPPSYATTSAIIFGILGLWHVYDLFDIVYASITTRTLRFSRPTGTPTQIELVHKRTPSIPERLATFTQPLTFRVSRVGHSIRKLSFDWRFTLREVVEVGMQTYQAYAISWTVTRPWINQLTVGSIVLNCLLTPLLSIVLRHREDTRRFYCIGLDLVLDFSCSIVVPFFIVYPYIVAYDPVAEGYTDDLFYDDVWRSNAFVEGRQVLITSFFDAVSTIIPHLSLLHCLKSVKKMLDDESTRPHHAMDQVHIKAVCPAPQPSKAPAKAKLVEAKRGSWLILSLVHVMLVGWGAVVATIHFQANSPRVALISGNVCVLRPRAWFARLTPCTVVNFNCARENTPGRAEDLTDTLKLIDRGSIASLIVMHCPALEMPAILTEFSALRNIDIYNATLVSWPPEAAVTSAHHPLLDRVIFVRTNVSTIPEGILHSSIPRSLQRVGFISTNLTRPPPGIEIHWAGHSFTQLSFEKSELVSDGLETLATVTSTYLNLPSNRLTSVPAALFSESRYKYILLSDNPLQELPSDGTVTNPGFLGLLLEKTNISSVPAWLTEYYAGGKTQMAFTQSPPCANRDATTFSTRSSLDTLCLPMLWMDILQYPMSVVERFRAV